MPDPFTIASQVYTLAKTIQEGYAKAKAAEQKIMLADLMNLVGDLKNELADGKLESAKLKEECHLLREEIKRLQAELNRPVQMVFRGGAYFLEVAEGVEDGPYCPTCWDDKKKQIRLADMRNEINSTRWFCGLCKNSVFLEGMTWP